MSPRLAKVMSRSATGRSRLALASVVVIRPCWNSAVDAYSDDDESYVETEQY